MAEWQLLSAKPGMKSFISMIIRHRLAKVLSDHLNQAMSAALRFSFTDVAFNLVLIAREGSWGAGLHKDTQGRIAGLRDTKGQVISCRNANNPSFACLPKRAHCFPATNYFRGTFPQSTISSDGQILILDSVYLTYDSQNYYEKMDGDAKAHLEEDGWGSAKTNAIDDSFLEFAPINNVYILNVGKVTFPRFSIVCSQK